MTLHPEGAHIITVIVDATTTFVDVMMKTTPWMQLLTLCHDSQVQVIVPEVVLRETARHWESEAQQVIDAANGKIGGIKKSRDRLTELGVDGSSLIESTPVTAIPDQHEFCDHQREKLVTLGVQIKGVPDHVGIETVLERDLARKKPFSNTGKGFRDVLVWETTKQVVLESDVSDHIFLVTGNSADYCSDSGSLAPELLEEVKAAAGTLTRAANLDDLLDHAELSPMVAGLAKTDEQLAEFLALAAAPDDPEPLPVGEVVKNAVLHALEQLSGEDVETVNETTFGLDFTELSIPSELEGLSIDVIEPDESTLTWQTYETYQDMTLLIQAEIHADVSLEGFAYKSDLPHLNEDAIVAVLEWDWNSHMSHVSTTTTARLIFQVRLEQGTNFADDCELEGVEPLDAIDPHG